MIYCPLASAPVLFVVVRAGGKYRSALQEGEGDGALLSTLSSHNGELVVLPDGHHVGAAVVGGEGVLRQGGPRPVALRRASHLLDAKSDLPRVQS